MKTPSIVNDLDEVAQAAYKKIKKLIILVVGVTVCLGGIVMLVLPGPGLVVIPAGLAILASEFVWARWLLRKTKKKLTGLSNSMKKITDK
ncbi:MAG: hypothetical protein NPINA01_23190 [Nitrospinaceae bacterium]|nr:MAG: hypothetical protein NPINA01_23190 [Nitrospinaceae bacterium]